MDITTQYPPLETTSRPTLAAAQIPKYPPLVFVTRSTLPTPEAAYYLNRKCQTLRNWACFESGPLRPLRINARLAWRVSDIRALLGETS
jgi:hypothetical protein